MSIQGYAWEAGETTQVVYDTDSREIHELYYAGGAWHHADITGETGALVARVGQHNNVAAYAWEEERTKHIVYVADDRRIYELSKGIGDVRWRPPVSLMNEAVLSNPDNAPPPAADAKITGYSWLPGPAQQVVYQSSDGHIHELYRLSGSTWQHADLTQIIPGSPPPSVSKIAAYAWGSGGSKQVVYLTADGHIHELYVRMDGIGWQHADLTIRAAGAPLVPSWLEPDLCCFSCGEGFRSKQILFMTSDGHIHELFCLPENDWQHADLTDDITRRTGESVPEATGHLLAGFYAELNQEKHIAYIARSGHIHELYIGRDGRWHQADLTLDAGAPVPAGVTSIQGYASTRTRKIQIVYTEANGDIHVLSYPQGLAGAWSHRNITEDTHSPRANPL